MADTIDHGNMKNNIYRLWEIGQYEGYFGNKTLNLKRCADFGFCVPDFVAIPSYVSEALFASEVLRMEISQKAADMLQGDTYAVRSSALIEDGNTRSFAGKFLTKTNLHFDELSEGIYDVLKQARSFFRGRLNNFSLIIQKYIAPDISGVAFTRNPNGGREMIIEYGFCEGDEIVGGKINPAKRSFYWDNQPSGLPQPFLTVDLIDKLKDLEQKIGFPQDIEWCVKDDRFYLLQARPITTISKLQYEQIHFLESVLPRGERFLFEKTEVSEIAPRPSNSTFSLLKRIYSRGGPIDTVYRKYGISYDDTNFLKVIGNELFIDKEKEIHGLLPSYSYLRNARFFPRFSNLLKTVPTLKNLFFLNTIRTGNYERIFDELKSKIELSKQDIVGLRESMEKFLSDYESVFEINLLSGLSAKKLNFLLKNESVTFVEIMSEYANFVDLKKYFVKLPPDLTGNSLELSDESVFVGREDIQNKTSEKVLCWWRSTSEFKKNVMRNKIAEAIIYARMREFGRWLVMKNICKIKAVLLNIAKERGFETREDIFFAGFDDILCGRIDEVSCRKNRTAHKKYDSFCLPGILASSLVYDESKIQGVSSGLAEGVLQDRKFIDNEKSKNKKFILCTDILSPDLTKYFGKISGILSNKGGLLSHLAIVAREMNIPVIVGFSMNGERLRFGDSVRIDGSSGKIEKLENASKM